MSSIANRIGPYHYGNGDIFEKKFDNDRTFTLLISSAYNAGVIGSEINGIVVLDDDNRSVILDRHLQQASGAYGSTERQRQEFERIKAMDWKDFSQFCHSNPRYRQWSAEDIETLADEPGQGDALNRAITKGKPTGAPGKNILTAEMLAVNADDSIGDKFPLTTREDITVFLATHHGHVPANYNNGGFCLAWDIKVQGNYDLTGKNNGQPTDGTIDPKYDEAWAAYSDNNEVFWDACSDALRIFTEGEFSTYPGSDQGNYKFATSGRSSGHLILTDWDGPNPPSGGWASCQMAFTSREDYIEWLKDLDDEDLVKLYKLTVSVDKATQDPASEVSYQIAFRRSCQEEAWQSGEPLPDGIELAQEQSAAL